MRIFWGRRLQWNVKLKPEALFALIESKNEGAWFDHLFGRGLSAKVSQNRFTLAKMSFSRVPISANGFAHVLAGRVIETQTGSEVVAHFRLAVPVFAFTAIWLGLAFTIGIIGGFAGLIRAISTNDMNQLAHAAFLFSIPAASTAVLNFLRSLGTENERYLKAVLDDTLKPHA